MKRFDFVIIGAGLGGLLCAADLVKKGFSVCVLEKNRQLGGNLQVFLRGGKLFDAGVHYLGGLDDGQQLNVFFRYFGIMDRLKAVRMDMDGFDLIGLSGEETLFPQAMGDEGFVENLSRFFPSSRKELTSWLEGIKKVCQDFPLYNLELDSNPKLDTAWADVSAKDFTESHISDPLLRQVLAGNNLLYAGKGDKTPLVLQALIQYSYIQSAWRLDGGAGQIVSILASQIRAGGGVIRPLAEVKKMRLSGRKVVSVALTNEEELTGARFIHAAHPSLLPGFLQEEKIKPAWKNRMTNLANTPPAFTVQLALKRGKIAWRNHNIYAFGNQDVWSAWKAKGKDWPGMALISMPARPLPDGSTDSLSLMTWLPEKSFAAWAYSFNTITQPGERGADYLLLKKEMTDKVILFAETQLPGLASAIEVADAATALTFRDYTSSPEGSMYGVERDFRQPLHSLALPNTPLENLFLTGQNVHMHGVLGVTVSAIITLSSIFGYQKVVSEVLECRM